MKEVKTILTGNNLGASVDSQIVEIGDAKRVTFTALITLAQGSASAPSSAPVGVWSYWFSHDRTEFFPLENDAVKTEMERMNATGNNVIRKSGTIHLPPGKYLLARYTRGSGGGAGANCEMQVELVY